jgi:hypothetical protein
LKIEKVNSLLLVHKKRANHPREVRNTFFHLVLPQKIWGAGLGKSVAGLGFARSCHQKKMIGLWIKSVKISILKQKKPKTLWISNKIL